MKAAGRAARVRRLYDRAAPRYSYYRDAWLAVAGQAAEDALLADVTAAVRPDQRVLDAGGGTGTISGQVRDVEPTTRVTMIDWSAGMLDRAADVRASRVRGSIFELPFPDNTFDLVVSAWVIETLADPRQAITELLRVLTPRGRLLYTFCSRPEGWRSRASTLALRGLVRWGFAGRFLPDRQTPWHACRYSRRRRFSRGLTTEISLGKCCTVRAEHVPVTRCR